MQNAIAFRADDIVVAWSFRLPRHVKTAQLRFWLSALPAS